MFDSASRPELFNGPAVATHGGNCIFWDGLASGVHGVSLCLKSLGWRGKRDLL